MGFGSLKEGLVSLSSQTCTTLAPLLPRHLSPEWAWEIGASESISTGLPDPLKTGKDPMHGDY